METLGKSPKISCGTLLVKDFTKYRLGAHTDAIEKIFSLLFYLPKRNNKLYFYFDNKKTHLEFQLDFPKRVSLKRKSLTHVIQKPTYQNQIVCLSKCHL